MENDYSYVGFVCIDEHNKFVLVTKTGNRYNVSGIKGDIKLNDIHIEESEAIVVGVKFFDGTESVTLEYAHSNEYEDIIIIVEHFITILNGGDLTIFEMVYQDFEGLNFFWGLLEEYLETDDGMNRFEKFVKKDNWNKSEII